MGIKTFLTLLISLGFSMSALADKHNEEEKAETPATEASAMPMMQEEEKPNMEKDLMFSADFAGSYSMLSSEEDPHGAFDVNLTQFNVRAAMGRSHLNMGFGYGSTVRDISEGTNKLGLLNAYYHMQTFYGLGFMMGRFESPVGHETYNHRMNSQFTRSYGFDLAPYFSTGLGLNYGQDMWKVGLLVTNGRGTDTDMDDDLTMAVTVDLDPMEGLHVDLNYVMGEEGDGSTPSSGTTPEEDDGESVVSPINLSTYSVSIIDVSVSYMINDMFNVALNYISNTADPDGGSDKIGSTSLAVYANAKYSYFNFGLRYEKFDFDLAQRGTTLAGLLYNASGIGLTGEGVDNSISSITLAARAEIAGNAGFLLEYRMDTADDGNTFLDADGKSADSFNRITAALMYNF